jgi:hypothetical protein
MRKSNWEILSEALERSKVEANQIHGTNQPSVLEQQFDRFGRMSESAKEQLKKERDEGRIPRDD